MCHEQTDSETALAEAESGGAGPASASIVRAEVRKSFGHWGDALMQTALAPECQGRSCQTRSFGIR